MPTKKTLNAPTTDVDAASTLVPGVQAPAMMDNKLNVLVTAMGEKGSAEVIPKLCTPRTSPARMQYNPTRNA